MDREVTKYHGKIEEQQKSYEEDIQTKSQSLLGQRDNVNSTIEKLEEEISKV